VNPGIQDLKPRQLHALVLLLVLLPLFPTALLLRFMAESARSDRTAVVDQLESVYATQMGPLGDYAVRNLDTPDPAAAAAADPTTTRERLEEFYRSTLGGGLRVRVLGPDDRPDRVAPAPWHPLDPVLLSARLPEWRVQLLLDTSQLPDVGLTEQVRLYRRLAITLIAGVTLIAVTAGWTVTRQLRLHELRNSAIAAVAHELKTPVASSRLLLETLDTHRHRDPALVGEYLDLLGGENRRIGRIIDNFLTLARMEQRQYPFQFSETPLGQVIHESVDELGIQLSPPRCRLTVSLPPRLPILQADQGALRMVFTNLLENAVKYSPEPAEIGLVAQIIGGTAVIQVSDRGVGIPPHELRDIFRPFRQADNRLSRAREGCGLGLSIVRHIVQAHKGRVWAENRPDGGSLFCVALPVPRNARSAAVEPIGPRTHAHS
jgi:signal transduction histidine kinase